MDSFWFKSKYQKSLEITRDHANVWVENMYKDYINLLTLIHNQGTQHIQQLLNEKDALKQMKDTTLQRLQNTRSNNQEKRDLLTKQQKKLNTLWQQDCEHAKRGYLLISSNIGFCIRKNLNRSSFMYRLKNVGLFHNIYCS